jgi:hypothetical protein
VVVVLLVLLVLPVVTGGKRVENGSTGVCARKC